MLTQEVCLETNPQLDHITMTLAADQPTILYVDDNPRSRRLLTTILRDCGFAVMGAGNAFEALLAAHRQRFGVALVDYAMPDLNGAQLSRRLKKIQPGLPVVVLSGMVALPSYEMCQIDAHFGRGAILDDLLATIRSLLRSGSPSVVAGTAQTTAISRSAGQRERSRLRPSA
jgi:CheY-like chemotaxis protein